ncbi:MAG: thioredoxin domain-containing protein, partial [Rhodothermales bacterium]|nr:thioredoxin domain-containing protein [Rhodothermales bacterium]
TAVGLGYGLGVSPFGWPGFVGRYVKGVSGDDSVLGFSPNILKVAIAAVAVFGVGYAWGLDHKQDLTGSYDIGAEVSRHFAQPVLDVQVHPGAAVWGNPDAAITIVEWADFQCPACRESAFHLRPALFEYRDDVKLVFMNYPLDSGINPYMRDQLHGQAGNAARAGVCAQEYGDFWEYHDDLFRNQAVLAPTLYTRLADERGWEPRPFAECMISDETEQRILSDIEMAKTAGVGGTPSIYIQGRKVALWRNTEFIWEILDRELANAD